MEEQVIELLARTSNKKRVDGLIAKVMSNPTAHILKLEYNKEFKNWCIWGYYDKPEASKKN